MLGSVIFMLAMLASLNGGIQLREAYPDQTLLWSIPFLLALYFVVEFLLTSFRVMSGNLDEED